VLRPTRKTLCFFEISPRRFSFLVEKAGFLAVRSAINGRGAGGFAGDSILRVIANK